MKRHLYRVCVGYWTDPDNVNARTFHELCIMGPSELDALPPEIINGNAYGDVIGTSTVQTGGITAMTFTMYRKEVESDATVDATRDVIVTPYEGAIPVLHKGVLTAERITVQLSGSGATLDLDARQASELRRILNTLAYGEQQKETAVQTMDVVSAYPVEIVEWSGPTGEHPDATFFEPCQCLPKRETP